MKPAPERKLFVRRDVGQRTTCEASYESGKPSAERDRFDVVKSEAGEERQVDRGSDGERDSTHQERPSATEGGDVSGSALALAPAPPSRLGEFVRDAVVERRKRRGCPERRDSHLDVPPRDPRRRITLRTRRRHDRCRQDATDRERRSRV